MNLKIKAVRYKFCGSAHRWDCMSISDGDRVLTIRHGGRMSCFPEDAGSFNDLFRAINKLARIEPTLVRCNEGAVLEFWEGVEL